MGRLSLPARLAAFLQEEAQDLPDTPLLRDPPPMGVDIAPIHAAAIRLPPRPLRTNPYLDEPGRGAGAQRQSGTRNGPHTPWRSNSVDMTALSSRVPPTAGSTPAESPAPEPLSSPGSASQQQADAPAEAEESGSVRHLSEYNPADDLD